MEVMEPEMDSLIIYQVAVDSTVILMGGLNNNR